MLNVNTVGDRLATVEGPGVPIATYMLDADGIVKQFQQRRGRDLWVACHSERIVEAVRAAFTLPGVYEVRAQNGTTIWTGEADSPEAAMRKASKAVIINKIDDNVIPIPGRAAPIPENMPMRRYG